MLGFARLAAASVALFGSLVAPSCAAADAAALLPTFVSMDTIFSFGDSYSTVGYKPQDGLTPLPGLGGTTSGGYNWVQFLAHAHNQSYFDFAQSGATVNNSIIGVSDGSVPSFDVQLEQFEQYFGGDQPQISWSSDESLFTVFFGINDIGFSVLGGTQISSEYISTIVASYERSVDALYSRGARKFLLLLLPPTYRTPYVRGFGAETTAQFEAALNLYVPALTTAISDLTARYPDATFIQYDPAPRFNAILDNAAAYGFAVSASSCWQYWNTHNPDNDLPGCEAPLADYVWMDDYHPTWSVHKLLAQDIAQTLTGTTTAAGSTLARRASGARTASFGRRRAGHGSARSLGRSAHEGAAHAQMRERMRRRWAGRSDE